MIWDCFIFNDEMDLLELRLRELWDVVDYFVLLEHDVSTRGKHKPFYFKLQQERFSQWAKKLVSVQYHCEPYLDTLENNRNFETVQRDHFPEIMRPLLRPNPGHNVADEDTIIFGDADEIADPECVRTYSNGMGAYRFVSHFSYYTFNCRRSDNVVHSSRQIIGPARMFMQLGFHFMRWAYPAGNNLFMNKGWHFSYLGGYDALMRKVESAAEGACSDWLHTADPKQIQAWIDEGRLYNGGDKFTFVPIDDTFPKTVRDNVDRYAKLGFIKMTESS